MAQFQVIHTVTLNVEAETEEDAQAQAEQWHGHVAGQQYDALAQMAPSVQVVSATPARANFSMSTGV